MKITRDVIQDLLPAYAAGEASADTVALVEEFLRQHPDMARAAESLRTNPFAGTDRMPAPDREKEALDMTRRLLRWRGILLGLAVFLTLFPFSFGFHNQRIVWRLLDMPPQIALLVCLAAMACWGGFIYVRRRLQGTGL
jgi:anti-sigma factor RsiW